jgi:hypothetical protein
MIHQPEESTAVCRHCSKAKQIGTYVSHKKRLKKGKIKFTMCCVEGFWNRNDGSEMVYRTPAQIKTVDYLGDGNCGDAFDDMRLYNGILDLYAIS